MNLTDLFRYPQKSTDLFNTLEICSIQHTNMSLFVPSMINNYVVNDALVGQYLVICLQIDIKSEKPSNSYKRNIT